jgi:hypothetical protein
MYRRIPALQQFLNRLWLQVPLTTPQNINRPLTADYSQDSHDVCDRRYAVCLVNLLLNCASFYVLSVVKILLANVNCC